MNEFLRLNGPQTNLETLKKLGKQIISGLSYLHSKQIIHQDLKPGNIILHSNYSKVKLIDLGISQKLKMNKTIRNCEHNSKAMNKSVGAHNS